jgi:hypothetical protein
MSDREMDDYERTGMIDSMQCKRDDPTEYVPPPLGTKWRVFRAIGMLPIEANDKAVLSLIVDHANPTTGRADPGQIRIARLLGLAIRTVKRSIARLLRTPYLSRKLRGLSSTAYQVNWAAILRHDRSYEAAKRCQTCPLDGDSAVPSVVSDLSPKNEKGKRKEKTKHEMAPSNEGAPLDAYLREEERGIQGNAGGDASIPRQHANERRGLDETNFSFWRQRERKHAEAIMVETDPDRRAELEAKLSRAKENLGKAKQ